MSWLLTVDELAEIRSADATVEVRILDPRYFLTGPDGRAEFEQAHLPGAVWIDLETALSGPVDPAAGGRHPLPEPGVFAAAMRAAGVDDDTRVVVVDDGSWLGAGRLWWMLRDHGHDRVQVLDGGMTAWTAAGLPTESGPGIAVEAGSFSGVPGHRRLLDAEAVTGRIAAGEQVLDVRAAARYRGEVEPIDAVAGHIPGAGHLDLDVFADDRTVDRAALTGLASRVRPDATVYCGSGVTASQAALLLAEAGLDGIGVYIGSWSDWISDPTRPIATGE